MVAAGTRPNLAQSQSLRSSGGQLSGHNSLNHNHSHMYSRDDSSLSYSRTAGTGSGTGTGTGNGSGNVTGIVGASGTGTGGGGGSSVVPLSRLRDVLSDAGVQLGSDDAARLEDIVRRDLLTHPR